MLAPTRVTSNTWAVLGLTAAAGGYWGWLLVEQHRALKFEEARAKKLLLKPVIRGAGQHLKLRFHVPLGVLKI